MARPGRQAETRRTTPRRKSRQGLRGIVSTIACRPDCANSAGAYYAAGSYSGDVAIFTPEGKLVQLISNAHARGVTQVLFSPDGMRMYTGGRRDESILCWDLRGMGRGEPIGSLLRRASTNQRFGFDLDSSGSLLVTGDVNGAVTVHDTSTFSPVRKVGLESLGNAVPVDAVNWTSFSPRGNRVAVSCGQRHFPQIEDSDDECDAPCSGSAERFGVAVLGDR